MYEENTEFSGTNVYPFVDSREQLKEEGGMSWRLTVDSEGIIREGMFILDKEKIDRLISACFRAIEISEERIRK